MSFHGRAGRVTDGQGPESAGSFVGFLPSRKENCHSVSVERMWDRIRSNSLSLSHSFLTTGLGHLNGKVSIYLPVHLSLCPTHRVFLLA